MKKGVFICSYTNCFYSVELIPGQKIPKCVKCGRELVLDKSAKPIQQAETEGIKHDEGKTDWTLLPWQQVEQIVKIMEFGAEKYDRDNWKLMKDPNRYTKAAMRHLIAYIEGEEIDQESGLSHLAHAACNMLFKMWFDDKEKNDKCIPYPERLKYEYHKRSDLKDDKQRT